MPRDDLRRPTFLILGAAKCGTTSLYRYLDQHPDVFMSYPKEPMFFAAEYERGLDFYWETYFRRYRGQRHAGEAAHLNLYLPYVAPRIRASLAEPRLVVICREPVERARSHYHFNRARGQEPLALEAAIEKNLERLERGPFFQDEREAALYVRALNELGFAIEYPSYVDAGHYAEQIERYIGLFGRDSLKILFTEDLEADPRGVAAEVFRFLGLEPVEMSDPSPANQAISPGLARLFQRVGAIPGMDRIPPSWREGVKSAIRRSAAVEKPALPPAIRDLLREHYRPHNRRLAELTGRNLDHWS